MASLKENKLIRYLSEARVELQKVSWPTRQTTVTHTLMVVGISLSLAVFLGAFDFLMNFGLERLLNFIRTHA